MSASFEESDESAKDLAGRLGLPLPQAPERQLEFPSDLGDVSTEELADHLGYWSSMAAYCRYKLAIMDSTASRAEVEANQEFDSRYSIATDKTVTDKKHNTGALRSVQSRQTKAVKFRGDATILAALLDGYEKKYHAVSRELSRRVSERDMHR